MSGGTSELLASEPLDGEGEVVQPGVAWGHTLLGLGAVAVKHQFLSPPKEKQANHLSNPGGMYCVTPPHDGLVVKYDLGRGGGRKDP